MKKLILLLLWLQGLIKAQQIAKTDAGVLNGAHYRIIFPENWKGKLLMYAHGYEFMGSPAQSKSPDWGKRMKPFLERGFAVAASDYQYQGLALAQGVDDTEALRKYFVKTYGKPDSTFIAGHSMGGGVTIASIEHLGKNYMGALAMCPLAGRVYLQTRKEFDLIATFNALFPGYMPSLAQILDASSNTKPAPMGEAFAKAMTIKKEIFAKDSLLAVDIADRFDLKPDDLPFSLAFGENVLRDVAKKLGGNPYDNTNTLYGGFRDNLLVNQKVERLAATIGQGGIFTKYDRTGNINKPTLALHTVYDQLIPAEMAIVRYENLVQEKGKQGNFAVKYTAGQGHCNFTEQQTSQAFDDLRAWVKTGKKAEVGYLK